MNDQKNFSGILKPSWTWADQLSSYRFWGLVLFYLFIELSFSQKNLSFYSLLDHKDFSESQITFIFSSSALAIFGGIYLAWFTHTKAKISLIIAAGILIVTQSLFIYSESYLLVMLNELIYQGIVGYIYILLISLIVGRKGTTQNFIICFGIIVLLNRFAVLQGRYVFYDIILKFDFGFSNLSSLLIQLLIPILLAIIVITPVNPLFFRDDVPERKKTIQPEIKSPVLTGLLGLVPFYNLYILFRMHGQVAHLSRSHQIVTPVTSVLLGLFVPFLLPLFLISLWSVLYKTRETEKSSAWYEYFYCFILYPVAFGYIQKELNELIA
ncbi:hypothetical protein GF406_13355 [candidate division KSB1 bacterium]|nr:hypothetical protein [candidate division KSB1 bacterium]